MMNRDKTRSGRGATLRSREEASKAEAALSGALPSEDYYVEPPPDFWEKKRADAEEHLRFMESLQDLPYYSRTQSPPPYIERYSDRFKPQPKKIPPLSSLGVDQELFPEEIRLTVLSRPARSSSSGKSLNASNIVLSKLETLEKLEDTTLTGSPKSTAAKGIEQNDLDEEEQSSDISEEDNDYVEEHYNDDDDAGSGMSGSSEGGVF